MLKNFSQTASIGKQGELEQGACMPRDNPKGTVVQEIALLSEEIDRLEQYVKDPHSLQARVQELTVKRADLLVNRTYAWPSYMWEKYETSYEISRIYGR
jgi:hypothetical protein